MTPDQATFHACKTPYDVSGYTNCFGTNNRIVSERAHVLLIVAIWDCPPFSSFLLFCLLFLFSATSALPPYLPPHAPPTHPSPPLASSLHLLTSYSTSEIHFIASHMKLYGGWGRNDEQSFQNSAIFLITKRNTMWHLSWRWTLADTPNEQSTDDLARAGMNI